MNELGIAPRGARRSRSDAFGQSARAASRGIQIGPRIRIGGTLGHIGQEVKEGVGKLAHNPLVDAGLSLIPGVGPLASGLIAAAGRAMDTSQGGVGVGDILKSGVEGYGAGKVANVVRSGIGNLATAADQNGGGLLGTAKSIVSGGGVDGKGNYGLAGDAAGAVMNGAKSALGIGGGGGIAGQTASGGPSTLDRLLLAASVADTAAQRARERSLQNKAIGYAENAYDQEQPMRKQAISNVASALDTPASPAPDASMTNNPYARSGYLVGGGRSLGPAVPVSQQRSGYLVGAA